MSQPLFIAPIDIEKGDDVYFSICNRELVAIRRDGKEIWNSEEAKHMSLVEKRNELTVELQTVLERFHEKNPDLFVNGISPLYQTFATGRKELMKLDVTIEVRSFLK